MSQRVLPVLLIGLLSAAGVLAPRPATAGQNVVVVLDDSGSMGDRMRSNRKTTKIAAAKSALISVLETLPGDAQVGIVRLNEQPSWVVPLGPVNTDTTRQAIMSIRANGGTPLGQFMKIGADALLQAREKDHYGSYRLLIVTDGEASDARLVKRYLPDIFGRGITVDVIGVDMAAKHSLATMVHSYRRADDPNMLATAVREVFAETTATGNDAGESDFDLLQPIPNQLASAALVALAETGNHPIGESPRRSRGTTEGADEDAQSASGGGPNRTKQQGQSRLGIFGLFVLLIVVAAIVNMIKAALRAGRR